MARILAGYLDGGSEEKLFFGGAGQFIQLMEKASGVAAGTPECTRLLCNRCLQVPSDLRVT